MESTPSHASPCRRFRRRFAAAVALAGILAVPAVAQSETVPLTERLQLCAGCHAPDGNSTIPANPKLAGLSADYLMRQLKDFKSGKRKSPVMAGIVGMVPENEFGALAGYYSEQKPAPGTSANAALAAQGKTIYDEGIVGSAVPACSGCHNEDGSGNDVYPRLAGQHQEYVVTQLKAFKNGERDNDSKALMRAVAKRMNGQEKQAVAEYIATLKEEQP